MRTTIHLVSTRDYWPFALGVRRARREWWLRIQKGTINGATMQRRARRLRRLLADGPCTANEVKLLATGYVGLWLDLVRVPPSGTWERRRADLLAAAEDSIGPGDATEAQGLERLVQRYLGAFGPAAPSDIASWSGVHARHLVPVLERLRLRRFRDEGGGELVDLPRQPLPDPETPAPVRFLPVWERRCSSMRGGRASCRRNTGG